MEGANEYTEIRVHPNLFKYVVMLFFRDIIFNFVI